MYKFRPVLWGKKQYLTVYNHNIKKYLTKNDKYHPFSAEKTKNKNNVKLL